jgi:KamA family protein
METSIRATAGYRAYTLHDLDELRLRYGIPRSVADEVAVVARVFPFRANRYVLDELIDWTRVPDDPIFRQVFPSREMLAADDFEAIATALHNGLPTERLARRIRDRSNPDCAAQSRDVPMFRGRPVGGLQHKYRESLLVFPSAAQTCHAHCTYCFRFPQFVETSARRMELQDPSLLGDYLDAHPEVTDVIFTGGDPFIAATPVLRRFVEPVLRAPAVRSVRFGTKSLAYWPQRVTEGTDGDALIRLLEELRASGRHVAVMFHSTHPRELQPTFAQAAIARLRAAGVQVRTQAPILRGINDTSAIWRELWREQVRLGCVPYYAFIPRDTGGHAAFDLPLAEALDIVRDAMRELPGIATTARGPVMSTALGKIWLVGEVTLGARRAFVLRVLRAADRRLEGETFLAAWDGKAASLSDLRPFEGDRFPFESPSRPAKQERRAPELKPVAEGTEHVPFGGAWGIPTTELTLNV